MGLCRKAYNFDPERADALFYLGQRLTLLGKFEGGMKPLATAANLSTPNRHLFQWVELYECLTKTMFAHSVSMATKRGIVGEEELLQYAQLALSLVDPAVNEKSRCLVHRNKEDYNRGKEAQRVIERYLREIDLRGYRNLTS